MCEKTREGSFGLDVRRKNHEGTVVEIVGKRKRAGKEEGQGDGNRVYSHAG
jgi:hypothetical protein